MYKSGAVETMEGWELWFLLPAAHLNHLRSIHKLGMPGLTPKDFDALDFGWRWSFTGGSDRFPSLRTTGAAEEGQEGVSKFLMARNLSTSSLEGADSHCRWCTFISVSPFAVCGQWSLTTLQGAG